MKLITVTEETVTLELSNYEIERLRAAHEWAVDGIEGKTDERLPIKGDTTATVGHHLNQISFLMKLRYVRREPVWYD